MKATYLPLISILFTCFSSAQNDFGFTKDHDALQVQDVNRSASFYSDILMLEEIDNAGLGDHIRWFQLDDKVQVHLIESTDTIIQNKGVHLAIATPRLEEFMKHLKEKQVHFENWDGEKGTTNSRPDGVKQIYLQDPDGYWIEVNDAARH